VRRSSDLLLAALHGAAEEFTGTRVRFEAFARLGESVQVNRNGPGTLERRASREFGVGCRVGGGGRAGFGAAAGSGSRAGREAARIALGAMHPGSDPLPPLKELGTAAAPEPRRLPAVATLEALLDGLSALLTPETHGVRLVQARAFAGVSSSAIATGEGFHARADAGGTVLELLVAPPDGPWRHFHYAASAVSELDPASIAERVRETALLATKGTTPERQLADVLLAPAVAAPIVEALVRHLTAAGDEARRSRVSRAWHLTDERLGPLGLLPLPWDGEGVPARRIELIRDGAVGELPETWESAQRRGGRPGGAVRPSYRQPPVAGPANLVVRPRSAASPAGLLSALAEGFFIAAPAGPLRVDGTPGTFAIRAAAVAVRDGKPVATHPLVELRGSFRRLLSGLLDAAADSESFSLGCAVTTPSLLVRRLEVA